MSVRPAPLTTLKPNITTDRKIKSSNFFYRFSHKLHSLSDFAYALSISLPLGWAIYVIKSAACTKNALLTSFFSKRKTLFSMPGKKCWVDSPGSFCLYCEQLRHKSAPSFSWFLPETILFCREPLWGSRSWYIPCCHMCAEKSNFSPSDASRNSGPCWGGGVAPCHHILVTTHQQHTFIEPLLCTKPCVKFYLLSLCLKYYILSVCANSTIEETIVGICWTLPICQALN